jgi:hypothetical protein
VVPEGAADANDLLKAAFDQPGTAAADRAEQE